MPYNITVFLFDKFSNHCLANAIEPLRAANSFYGSSFFSWKFVTLDGKKVISSSGLPIIPNSDVANIQDSDDLFVLSGYDYELNSISKNISALRIASQNTKRVVGMDTGAWLMASAGLLNGMNATIHWDALDHMAEHFPDVNVVEDRFVIGNNIATTGGVTTTFDFILEMIEAELGAIIRLNVAAFFRHGYRSRISDPLLRMTNNQKIDAATALMLRNLENILTIDELAKEMRMSKRKLNLIFKKYVGNTAINVYIKIRLNEAKRLIQSTKLSISEVALRTGYQNPAAFSRAFKNHFGILPNSIRK